MSEEVYIKAPCCECNGRVSLPLDAVGVDFNCPHCGAGLQMLLKHVCEHCNGKLSFDDTPEAIGAEVQCGHCQNQTVLSPSTFSNSEPENVEPEPDDNEEEDHPTEPEQLDEPVEEEVGVQGSKPKRRGPPRPRAPRRGAGPPRPRPKKSANKPASGSPEAPAKIGRRLAGSGGGTKEPDEEAEQPKLKAPLRKGGGPPKRSNKIESADEARAPSPRRTAGELPAHPAEELAGSDPMDPMSDLAGTDSAMTQVVSGNRPAPVSPAPVQRQVAGGGGEYVSPTGGTVLPQPTFQALQQAGAGNQGSGAAAAPVVGIDENNGDGEVAKKSLPKWAAALIGLGLTLGFVYFILPTALEIFDPMLAKKVRQYTRFQFETAPRRDTSKDFQINHAATAISQLGNTNGTFYVTGSVENISSANYQQVELKIELYDGQGALLGETLDYTNQLGPNVTWNFKAACLLTNAASAKVVGVIARK